MNTVGDLGRRVAERRHDLGLTTQEVATRAGMDPHYLGRLERSPAPQLPGSALWRLAAALDTSVAALTGSGMEAPPGRADPSERPVLEPLSPEECRTLIAPGGIGRVLFVESGVPVALPVNYRSIGEDVVFRTEEGASVLAHLPEQDVSFEVDHLDEALAEGWSVLISGRGRTVIERAEHERVQALDVAPWAGGARDIYVRIAPDRVTGRRIRRRSGGG
jgi:nitroimidazol reductase NimA-like FMN-containing flavoprotein (pyridoxamine 5'-phosphate oxidase superfamily)